MIDAPPAIRIHPADNVAVAVRALSRGCKVAVDDARVVLVDDVPAGHKFALQSLAPGAPVVKYGCPIGAATAPIRRGVWVHTHNLKTCLEGVVDYGYEPSSRSGPHPLSPSPVGGSSPPVPLSLRERGNEGGESSPLSASQTGDRG